MRQCSHALFDTTRTATSRMVADRVLGVVVVKRGACCAL